MNVAGGAGDAAQRGEGQQPEKQQQKEDLRNSAPQRQPGPDHKPLPTPRARAISLWVNDRCTGRLRTVILITSLRFGLDWLYPLQPDRRGALYPLP